MKKMILRRELPDKLKSDGWINRIEEFEVIVMAIVDKYAMVRRKGCMPFVVSKKELHE